MRSLFQLVYVAMDEVPLPERHDCIDWVSNDEYRSIATCLWEEKNACCVQHKRHSFHKGMRQVFFGPCQLFGGIGETI